VTRPTILHDSKSGKAAGGRLIGAPLGKTDGVPGHLSGKEYRVKGALPATGPVVRKTPHHPEQ